MTTLTAPSTHLPPINKIQTYSNEDLTKAIRYLRLIYNPDVHEIRRVDRDLSQSTPTDLAASLKAGSRPSPDPNLEALRSDAFERAYAIRWLTALVSQAYQLLDRPDGDVEGTREIAALEALLQQASALLAICAGTASAGTITRTFRFHSSDVPIEVQLTDVPLENHDFASVGAQTWGSACLLAQMLVEDPAAFGLGSTRVGLRVLELGAGTGLVSVTLRKLLHAKGRSASLVVTTDFHPSVLANLKNNIAANFPEAPSDPASIDVHFLDWEEFPALQDRTAPFDESFDLVFGADIVYEAEHAPWIKNCVEELLRKPNQAPLSTLPEPTFHLVIPLRPTHTLESTIIEELFPFAEECGRGVDQQLVVLSKDVIAGESIDDVYSRSGALQEVEYVHYTIGWRS